MDSVETTHKSLWVQKKFPRSGSGRKGWNFTIEGNKRIASFGGFQQQKSAKRGQSEAGTDKKLSSHAKQLAGVPEQKFNKLSNPLEPALNTGLMQWKQPPLAEAVIQDLKWPSPLSRFPTWAPTSQAAKPPDGLLSSCSTGPAALGAGMARLQDHYPANAMTSDTQLTSLRTIGTAFPFVYLVVFHNGKRSTRMLTPRCNNVKRLLNGGVERGVNAACSAGTLPALCAWNPYSWCSASAE